MSTRPNPTGETREGIDGPLSICLLTYRGKPTCGGQGVYVKRLSRALKELEKVKVEVKNREFINRV